MNTFLCEHIFSVLLGAYLEAEWLNHVVTLFKLLRNFQAVF